MNDININGEKNLNMNWLAVILCILPILSPYALFGMSLSLVVILGILGIYLIRYRGVYLHKTTGVMLFYMLAISIVNALFTPNHSLNLGLSIRVSIIFFIYLLFFSNGWKFIDNSQDFFFIAVWFGKICAILAIFQFVAVSLGYTNFYTGRLPFPLDEYSTFASLVDPVTGALRVHSFFEEPSYLAIYELPVFAYLFQRGNYLWSMVIAFSCVVSSSVLGITGIIIIAIVLFFGSSISTNKKIQITFILIILLVLFLVIVNKSSSIQNLFDYYMRRYLSIGKDFSREDSSISQRIVGNFQLFSKYNLYNKICGVGINQYPIYFGLSQDYSNDFVSTLLNFGYFGIISLSLWILALIRECKKQSIVYLIIVLLVLAIDHTWFSDNFFYLLSWFVFSGKRKGYVNLKFGK